MIVSIFLFPPMQAEDSQLQQLINAINQGEPEEIEQIIANAPLTLLNTTDSKTNFPPLYFAVLAEDDERSAKIIYQLLRRGADIKFKDSIQQSVLFYACRQGKEKCAELLQAEGLSLDDPDEYGQTPIFYAVTENRLEIVRKYATKQRVNHVDKLADQTPLYYAVKKGLLEMTKLLVEKGADITHTDRNSKTALEVARKSKYTDVIEYLSGQMRRNKDVRQMSMMISQSVEESNLQRRNKKKEDSKPIRQTYKIVHFNQKGESHDLTEEEVRQMIKNKPELEAFLTNPESIPQEVIDRSNNSDQWQKVATKVLSMCFKLKGSFWFQEPVDPVKYNIMDYFDIISHPMDLGTIRRKLTHNCYSTARQFASDVALIWQNCYKYNGEDHQISRCAKQIELGFKEYYNSTGLSKFDSSS